MIDSNELNNRFVYHKPDDKKAGEHAQVRAWLHRTADDLNSILPDGREKAVVMTKLEEAMFWANAAIARNG